LLNEVARRLRRAPGSDEIAAAEKAGAWDPLLPAWDEKDVSKLVRHLKECPPRVEVGEAPDHWPEHSEEVMERFAQEQHDAQELFDLTAPLELSEVAGFLIDRAVHEPTTGDPLTMMLPSVKGYAEGAIRYFRGYFEDEWDRKNRKAFQAPDAEERIRLLHATREWALQRANPLYRFSLIVEDLVEATGIDELGAIAFLLADATVVLSRLGYQTRMRMGSKNPGTTITVTISDLSVKPKEVAQAYAYVRSQMLRDRIIFPLPDRQPRQRIREQSDRTRAMRIFCRARQGEMKFPQILAEWNKAHPEWKYATPRSLYNAYHVAQRRWGIPKKAKQ
jgi:hypothetical protein